MVKITIEYNTAWGETLVLRQGKKVQAMEYVSAGLWQLTLPALAGEYTYELHRDGVCVRKEWRPHFAPKAKDLVIRDRWNDGMGRSPFCSQFFTEVVFRRDKRVEDKGKGNLTLILQAPEIRSGQAVALAGSGKALGNWKKFHRLSDTHAPEWRITLDVQEAIDYKFLVIDDKTGKPLFWENGDNRHADVPQVHEVQALTVSFPTRPWRGAGTAVPVFSLRTEDSFGIGEFADIKKLVDWAVLTGQNLIQLLPINDTTMTGTWQDSYPYNANSTFALHPQFVHLPAAGVRADKAYKALRDELNALPSVDYERVNNEKARLLRKVYATQGAKVEQTPAYQDFRKANDGWLIPYAVFCCLRDAHGTPDFSQWGAFAKYTPAKAKKYAAEHPAEVGFYCFEQYHLDAQLKDAVAYAHAHGVGLKGDLPIGISRTSVDAWAYPELFHLDSQAGAPPDAFAADGQNWGFPTYNWEKMAEDGFSWWKARMSKMSEYFDAFRIDHILGFFRIWEIPLPYKSGLMGHFSPALPYSGDELRAQGFDIDWLSTPDGDETNVLFLEDPRRKGFYHPRIGGQRTAKYDALAPWQKDRFNALYNDFFYKRHNQFWKDSAMFKLPSLLGTTDMLTCGEDLGMIPDCVPDAMRELGVLSLEIQRMPKSVTEEFANPAYYPYFCVCATGTHDTSPLRAWWEEDREVTAHFYYNMLGCGGEVPYFCEPWVCERVVDQHLKSPAMLTVLPLQDWLSIDGQVRYQGNPADERINVPAIPRYYWRYRMHLTLEQLIQETDFNAHLKGLIADSGRGE